MVAINAKAAYNTAVSDNKYKASRTGGLVLPEQLSSGTVIPTLNPWQPRAALMGQTQQG